MGIKNIYHMKQPELGKRISDLRKQKGLTQEELVEKCNINVRTIQRIEAGNVTPRSFTLRTIFEALEVNLDAEMGTNEGDIIISSNHKRKLDTAWIFGIIYFAFGVIEIIADYYQFNEHASILNTIGYSFIKIISILTFVFFMNGFITVSKVYNHKWLKSIVYVMIIIYAFLEIFDVFVIHLFDDLETYALIVKPIVMGPVIIIFGIQLLKLKKHLGAFVQVNGIMEIITGACLSSVLLTYLALFLTIPVIILEIILLYRVANSNSEN